MRHSTAPTRCCLTAIAALLLLALPAAGDTQYTVRSGDSVWSVAQKHDMSYLALLRANGLAENAIIQPGQELVIPGSPASSPQPSAAGGESSPEARSEGIHVVREGESLWVIAERYGTTVSAVAAANNCSADSLLRVGSRLKVPGAPQPEAKDAEPATPEPRPPRTHSVRRGESLWLIAEAYGTSVPALAAANGLRPEKVLRAGRKLVIPTEGNGRPAGKAPVKTVYVVRKGDSLWWIARRHGTTVRALAEMNGVRPDSVLRVGAVLEVPGAAGSDGAFQGQHRFVQAALQYRGVRYRYGGMSTRGMDCSGLVALVLRNYGIKAPHNSKALYKLGKPVSRENLQPGDLVFFHTTRAGISHVGIYIGDGKFVHASSSKGRVRVDSLDKGYYSRRLVGAKRVS